ATACCDLIWARPTTAGSSCPRRAARSATAARLRAMESQREDVLPDAVRPDAMRGAGGSARIETFRTWLEEFGTALETQDPGAVERLFVIESTYRPTPFAPVLRGRRQINEHLATVFAARPGMRVSGRALGVGATYAIAH